MGLLLLVVVVVAILAYPSDQFIALPFLFFEGFSVGLLVRVFLLDGFHGRRPIDFVLLHGIVPGLAVIDEDLVVLGDGFGGHQVDQQTHAVFSNDIQRIHFQQFLVVEFLPPCERFSSGLCLRVLVRVPLEPGVGFQFFVIVVGVVGCVQQGRRGQPEQTGFRMAVHVVDQELFLFVGERTVHVVVAVFFVVSVQLGGRLV
mmetsp:Transcript_13045/g.27478  ORF Transcript_13045/g.27478 Transcript_13045/m.27478 type:complete len:201 (+) Transcript_13045:1153-1755(+)